MKEKEKEKEKKKKKKIKSPRNTYSARCWLTKNHSGGSSWTKLILASQIRVDRGHRTWLSKYDK
jgi:hypothetical protein